MSQSNGSGLSLAILTTAIGATVAVPAHAALVSEVSPGFTPVTITANDGIYSFDMDGNGSNDFTIQGNGTNVVLNYLDPSNGAQTFAGTLTGYTSPSSLAIGNIKSGTSGAFTTSFGTAPGDYAALVTNATFNNNRSGTYYASSGTLGYLQGTYTDGNIPSFQLLDYGLVTADTAVPEPTSLALLATGAAGVAALRRRRAAKARAKAA